MAGITLLELILVMAILAILGVVGFGVYYNFSLGIDIEEAQNHMVEVLRQAKGNATAVEQGYAWGVRFDNLASGTSPFYVLFAGNVYGHSATTSTTTLSSALEFTSPASGKFVEVLFTKRGGTTTAATTTTIRLKSDTNVAKTINVSAQGLISK